MENEMFCFQCQETAFGTGCKLRGVCGKMPQTANDMDLLLSIVMAVGTITHVLKSKMVTNIPKEVDHFICDALFSTITNANFDDESIIRRIDIGIILRNQLVDLAKSENILLPLYDEILWDGNRSQYKEQAIKMSVLRNEDADIRS